MQGPQPLVDPRDPPGLEDASGSQARAGTRADSLARKVSACLRKNIGLLQVSFPAWATNCAALLPGTDAGAEDRASGRARR